ncbi:MAG: sulfite exporter TauE/SafE family protein [Gemmatimonadota bacterium]|nr:sulfite exporter TauE/SafE family protein [Gemmatimonadota bacterium]
MFLAAIFAVAVLSGATAAVAGFGIGSLLTPVLATRLGTAAAIAAVAIPHAAATALRFVRLRRAVDWRVIRSFGVLSAVGGLAGALLYARLSSRVLTIVLGVLLIATAVAGLTGWVTRWRATGARAATLGLLSGLFGGIAGNQGGLRAAALLGFRLAPAAYVATSTAIALLVDAARTPVYVWRAGSTLADLVSPIAVATIGVLLGTLLGERLLLGLPVDRFRRIVSILIGLLGAWLLASSVWP